MTTKTSGDRPVDPDVSAIAVNRHARFVGRMMLAAVAPSWIRVPLAGCIVRLAPLLFRDQTEKSVGHWVRLWCPWQERPPAMCRLGKSTRYAGDMRLQIIDDRVAVARPEHRCPGSQCQ